MAWHLAEPHNELHVARKTAGECANTVGGLVEFGGDVLLLWWRVLLGGRPPTLGLLGIMGLERVVRVVMRSMSGLAILLLMPLVGPLHILVRRGVSTIGVIIRRLRVPAVVCSGGAGKKNESGEFLHI